MPNAWLLTIILVATLASTGRAATLTETLMSDRVIEAVFGDPRVEGVRVAAIDATVERDVVTLRGRVASEASRHAAGEASAAVKGVGAVRNELVVEPADEAPPPRSDASIRKDVRRALQAEPALRRVGIRVGVERGIVRLDGQVADVTDRTLASRVARRVVGARAVRNDLFARSVELRAPR